MSEEKLVPKLRFRGFTEVWIKVPAGEIFKNVSNKNHDGNLPILAVTQDSGVVTRDSIDYDIKTSEKSIKSYKIIEPGDYVISLRSFQGGIEYSDIKGICSPAYTVLKPKKDIFDDFYKFYFKKEEFISRLNYAVIGIRDGKQISYKDFSEIKIPYTSVHEQKLISEFLNVIEDKINLLNRKHEEYLNFKKYLTQQIFTQKLRFDKECIWEEYQLYDIGETYNGLSGLSKDNFEKGDSQFITYKSIFDNNILSSNFTDNVELNNKSQNIVKKGDLFFTGSSETPEEVGMVSVLNCNIENCYLNSFCFGYRLNDNANINPIFLAYYLRSPVMRNKIMVLAQGSTRFNLSKKEILKLKINIPPITGQQKIKDLFQYLDKNINIISNQLHCINEFKRGLLQQMFV